MEQTSDAWDNLAPRQQRAIFLYVTTTLPMWKVGKIAGYQGKEKRTLAAAVKEVLEKYEFEASQEEKFRRTGVTVLHWLRNIFWLERHAKAKRDLSAMGKWIDRVGESEPIGLLKKKGEILERGATIIIRTEGEAQTPKQDKKLAPVASIRAADD